MGFWVHNECGGKLKIILTEIVLKDYNIDEQGNPVGKCLKKSLEKEYSQISTLCFSQPKVKVLFCFTNNNVSKSSSVKSLDETIQKFIEENNAKVLNVDIEKTSDYSFIITIIYENEEK